MSTTNRKLEIEKGSSGQRLDKFLVSEFPDRSRGFWQKAIKEGAVLVNRKPAAVHCFLKEGDRVEINGQKIEKLRESRQISLAPDKSVTFDVIFENDDFAVINKPARLIVHPSPISRKSTLVNGLLARYPQIKGVGEDVTRPGIVHRLDKDASGAMVVAKTQEAYEHLKAQFKDRRARKEYLVLAKGRIDPEKGTINAPVGRSKFLGKMSVRPKGEGKPALTEYEVIRYYGNLTLAKARIKTGRTHQIRVHFSSIGHPLVGDKIYKPRKMKLAGKETDLGRIFLHSARLGIEDTKGQWREFEAPLPEELEKYLEDISTK